MRDDVATTTAMTEEQNSDASLAHESVACLICGGSMRPGLTVPGDWRRPQVRASYEVVRCAECDFGQLHPRPTLDELTAAYDVNDYYTHASPQAVGSTAGRLLERLRVRAAWSFDRSVEAEIDANSLTRHGVRSGAAVCDVGCGNGGLLRRLQQAGFHVVGIEPDAEARATARDAGLRVCAGSGESLPPGLADARFDVVTMTHVLEHCLDPAAAVRNVAGLLDDGGLFFVETPNNACLGARRAGAAWRWLDVPRHLNFFTPESLQTICRRADLEIVAVEYTGYTRQFRADWMAEEEEIRRRLAGATPNPRRAACRAAGLLTATCCAAAKRKYDSVRVVARKR